MGYQGNTRQDINRCCHFIGCLSLTFRFYPIEGAVKPDKSSGRKPRVCGRNVSQTLGKQRWLMRMHPCMFFRCDWRGTSVWTFFLRSADYVERPFCFCSVSYFYYSFFLFYFSLQQIFSNDFSVISQPISIKFGRYIVPDETKSLNIISSQ